MIQGPADPQDRGRKRGLGSTARLALNTALAAAAALLAAGITAGFFGFFDKNVFLLFLVAVLASNLLGGWIPGAAASITSVLLLAYYIFEPRGRFVIAGADDLARLAVFATATVVVGVLSHSLLVARERARSRETRLRESEESYRGLFDNTVDAVFLIDRDRVVIEANPAASVSVRAKCWSAFEVLATAGRPRRTVGTTLPVVVEPPYGHAPGDRTPPRLAALAAPARAPSGGAGS